MTGASHNGENSLPDDIRVVARLILMTWMVIGVFWSTLLVAFGDRPEMFIGTAAGVIFTVHTLLLIDEYPRLRWIVDKLPLVNSPDPTIARLINSMKESNQNGGLGADD